MPARKDPIETMTAPDKLLRVGVLFSFALLLGLATWRSASDGTGGLSGVQVASVQSETADVADEAAPAAEVASADPVMQTETAGDQLDEGAENSASAQAPSDDSAAVSQDVADAATEEASAPAMDSDAGTDWLATSALLANADIDAGETAFRQCSTCHQHATERNGVGPHLVGIVGRTVAAVDGWRYSDALQNAGGIWTPERLDEWLASPNDYLPGNRMAYPGVSNAQERINIIGFLAARSDG